MEWVQSLGAVDAIALFVFGVAVARGWWNGAVREAFSLGALAVACIVARLATGPVSAWLTANAATEPNQDATETNGNGEKASKSLADAEKKGGEKAERKGKNGRRVDAEGDASRAKPSKRSKK